MCTPIALHCVHPFVPSCFAKVNAPHQEEEKKSRWGPGLKAVCVLSAYVLDCCGPIVLLILGILGAVSTLSLPPAASYSFIGGGIVWGAVFWTWGLRTRLGSEPFFKPEKAVSVS